MTNNGDEPDVYVGEVTDGTDAPHTSAIVALTPISAGNLTDEHIGRHLGFHDERRQLNLNGEILRVEHNDGPPSSVSVWFRYTAPVVGAPPSGEDFMQVAPWFKLQLVETLPV